jgi:quercetin dioxygenase-like cupin family protein
VPAAQAVVVNPGSGQAPVIVYDDGSDFGLPNEFSKDKGEKVYMTITEIKEGPREELIFSFDNGQEWRQRDAERYKVKVGDVIYIERGAIGSFWLSKDDVRKRIRVRRNPKVGKPTSSVRQVVVQQVAQPQVSAPVAAQQVAPQQIASSVVDNSGVSNFGLPTVSSKKTDKRIYMTIARLKDDPRQKLMFVFENGQVWKQTDNGELNLKEGDRIYIERGAVGSFWLSQDDIKKRIKVKREDRGTGVDSDRASNSESAGASNSTTTTADDFGLPRVKKVDPDEKIYMTITKVSEGPRGKLKFTFDNGQVWKQSDSASINIKEGDVVYIERGAIGSFWLSQDSIKKRIRVKRDR